MFITFSNISGNFLPTVLELGQRAHRASLPRLTLSNKFTKDLEQVQVHAARVCRYVR